MLGDIEDRTSTDEQLTLETIEALAEFLRTEGSARAIFRIADRDAEEHSDAVLDLLTTQSMALLGMDEGMSTTEKIEIAIYLQLVQNGDVDPTGSLFDGVDDRFEIETDEIDLFDLGDEVDPWGEDEVDDFFGNTFSDFDSEDDSLIDEVQSIMSHMESELDDHESYTDRYEES